MMNTDDESRADTVNGRDNGRPLRKPYLTADGTLVIPFDSDPKYHWWKGGQSVAVTRAEVMASIETKRPGQIGSRKVG